MNKSNDSVPIAQRYALTVDEAAKYSGIGVKKLREMSDSKDCPFVLWNGNKRMIKREALVRYLNSKFSI